MSHPKNAPWIFCLVPPGVLPAQHPSSAPAEGFLGCSYGIKCRDPTWMLQKYNPAANIPCRILRRAGKRNLFTSRESTKLQVGTEGSTSTSTPGAAPSQKEG